MIPILSGNVASATASTGYTVDNSCRWNDGDLAYMHKTFGTSTDVDKCTISVWVKRCALGATKSIVGSHTDDNNRVLFGFEADQLQYRQVDGGSTTVNLITTQVFRDVSAWYHIVLSVDTGQGTAANRIRLYVNGSEVTSFGTETNPSQDLNFGLNNSNIVLKLVQQGEQNDFFDGYMSEFVFIDGQQLTPTSFGEFDSDSPTIWKPIDVSGLTFGTNGFYLDFEDSSNLGNDANGGTDLTEVNLAATDQTTDTPTNSFATLNPLVNFNSGVFSEGNCAITYGDDTISTIGVTKGRWYWEAQRTNTTTEAHFGIGLSNGFYSATSIVSDGDRLYTRSGATYFSAVSNLSILTFGSNNGTSAAVANGDVIGFYLDLESATKNITIKKNDGATPIVDVDLTYSGAEPIFAFCRMNSGCASSWNFGNPVAALTSANSDPNGYGSFEFSTTLSGVDYYALCTKNLAEFG